MPEPLAAAGTETDAVDEHVGADGDSEEEASSLETAVPAKAGIQ
jgi:hypothetical protein